jgi:hypothetical protein
MIHVWMLLMGLALSPFQAHNSNANTAPAPKPVGHGDSKNAEENSHNMGVSRCLTAAESPSQRVSPPRMIAPGLPPLLSFRYYEGRAHYRFGNNDLMLDDAGH